MDPNSSISNTDLIIIRSPQKDQRNLCRIADNLEMSIGKLYYRIKKLGKKGILKKYIEIGF